jgi:hypothetical protein
VAFGGAVGSTHVVATARNFSSEISIVSKWWQRHDHEGDPTTT